jgi:histidine triad (HIT) family protein
MPTDAAASDDAPCLFCEIVAGRVRASIVAADASTIAFMDTRQFHPGHVLVIPRRHVADIRDADDATAATTMRMVARVARAVDRCFPADGLSVWHSAGPGAHQEVPHLHVHVHPRHIGDKLLRVYPRPPAHPDRATLDAWSADLRRALEDDARGDA